MVVLHLMDPPRSEAAMAAALPLAGVDAWRVYLGLPMFGTRAPAGGFDEIMRLATEDALLNMLAPVIEQAAAELPAAIDDLRRQLDIGGSPVCLVGGSAGGAAVLLALATTSIPVVAAAAINAAVQAEAVIEAGEGHFGVKYTWNEKNRAKARELDFVGRAGEITARSPQVPLLVVIGDDDDPAFVRAEEALYAALKPAYANPDDVSLFKVPGLAHGLAEEPGVAPAPQLPTVAPVDAEVSRWLNRYLLR